MISIKNNEVIQKNAGLISIIFSYTIWGIQPLYWRTLQDIPLIQLLAHRIIWSTLLLTIVIIYTGRLKELITTFRVRKKICYIIISAFLIGFNWLLNIYAAYSNQVIEASLGHYMSPIMTIFLGIFIFKENVKFYELLALAIAFIGVAIMSAFFGRIPMIAVLLIITFILYTVIKKIVDIDPIIGIISETIILFPFALIYLTYSELGGKGLLANINIMDILLLMSTVMFTAVPLILFSYGVKQVNLSKIGFIQYYAPTLSLFIGIFIFKESFTKIHFIAFSFIWIAMLIVSIYPICKSCLAVLKKDISKTS